MSAKLQAGGEQTQTEILIDEVVHGSFHLFRCCSLIIDLNDFVNIGIISEFYRDVYRGRKKYSNFPWIIFVQLQNQLCVEPEGQHKAVGSVALVG